ncbi:MAG: hypothetical protein DIU74_005910 [Pseudomonadota bacterium]
MLLHLSVPPQGERDEDRPVPEPQQVAKWLSQLRSQPAQKRARQIIAFLGPLNRRRMRVALRQSIGELVLTEARPVVAELGTVLDDGTVPLDQDARSNVQLADQLLKELAYTYKLLLVEQARRLFGLASSGRAQLPAIRAMQLLAERLVLSYRMYAMPPQGVWLELHTLYHFALRRGFAQKSIDGEDDTPLSVYRDALLLAFAEPLTLMRGDLDRVRTWIALYGQHAQLSAVHRQQAAEGLFVVKNQRDLPGYALLKRHQPPPQPHDSLLNTSPLSELLVEQLQRLQAGATLKELGLPETIGTFGLEDLLTRLARQWGNVPGRRYERLRTHTRVCVHVGIADIWQFLNGHMPARSADSQWIITNESPGGFALVHENGPLEPLRVGEVIGIRSQRDDNCHICVVRWLRTNGARRIELGVEEISPSARAASIRKLRDATARNPEPVLLLPEMRAFDRAPAIVASHVPLDVTCEIHVGDLQSRLQVKPTQLLERTVSMQMLGFKTVD